MGQLIINEVSAAKTESARKDGKKSRQYVTVKFADKANPLTGLSQRNFFQNHSQDGKSCFWKGLKPEALKAMEGETIEGEIVRAEVDPYMIGDREANSYTAVVLKGEFLDTVLKQAGHYRPGQTPKRAVDSSLAAK